MIIIMCRGNNIWRCGVRDDSSFLYTVSDRNKSSLVLHNNNKFIDNWLLKILFLYTDVISKLHGSHQVVKSLLEPPTWDWIWVVESVESVILLLEADLLSHITSLAGGDIQWPVWIQNRAGKDFAVPREGHSRALPLLKVPTSAFTIKNMSRVSSCPNFTSTYHIQTNACLA